VATVIRLFADARSRRRWCFVVKICLDCAIDIRHPVKLPGKSVAGISCFVSIIAYGAFALALMRASCILCMSRQHQNASIAFAFFSSPPLTTFRASHGYYFGWVLGLHAWDCERVFFTSGLPDQLPRVVQVVAALGNLDALCADLARPASSTLAAPKASPHGALNRICSRR